MTTIATWNIGDGPDEAKLRGFDRLVHYGADVICLQEAGDRGKAIDRWCAMTGWHAWMGDGSPGAASVPMLWNPKKMDARHTGTTPATPATKVGSLGAGPSTMKAKVWNRVRFSDTGPLVVINGHIVPSVYLPSRRRIAKHQVEVLAAMVEQRAGRADVAAVMDGNSKASDRLWKPLRELGMKQHTHDATHGRRTIDLTWTHGIGGRTVVVDMPSDHRAALITLKEHR